MPGELMPHTSQPERPATEEPQIHDAEVLDPHDPALATPLDRTLKPLVDTAKVRGVYSVAEYQIPKSGKHGKHIDTQL